MSDRIGVTRVERARRRGSRPTIGYLAQSIQDAGQSQWSGVVDEARKRDVNLLSFVGGYWADPRGFQAQANVLYDLVGVENVDGVVSWASTIGLYVTADETRILHERYHALPLVAIGGTFEGIPGLFVDTYEGMHAAITHLIEVHGCRRLAFVSGPEGNPYAEERHRACTDALEAHGLCLDPNLVTPPVPWEVSLGRKSMRLLLDERRLRPQVDFDAVVAASDTLLLGALETLQARGVRVPDDVSAVGFDDIMEGRVSTPPFTTGVRPFYAVGCQAVGMLLALIEGAPLPVKTIVPSEMVIRQSCGCLGPAVGQAVVGPVEASDDTLESVLASRRAEVLLAMAQAVGESEKVAGGEVERFLDGFVGELRGGTPGLLMRKLDEALRQTTAAGGDVAAWQGAISALRRQMLPYLRGRVLALAEDLWQQARVAVAEMALRTQAQAQLQTVQQAQVLREVGTALITTFDVEELMPALTEGLPRLGIPSCYISLYENPQEPAEWSRLVLAYNENGPVELESGGRRFRSRQLVPEGVLPDRQYSFVVEPLYFRERQLGFVLLEVGPHEGMVYDVLGGEISNALRGALLLHEREQAEAALEQAYTEVERQVQERTAELEREAERRERAQAENLRLQQEIIEAQKHALQELSTPIIPVLEGIIVVPLIGSIDTMRARDLTRALLAGVRQHRAKVVIVDVTGVPMVDSGVADYLNKTIQAARLKGARTIVTGISDAVAETIVDLGIDWGGIETLSDLQTGLVVAFGSLGVKLAH
jgi:DNA-binding LacI/PurR family transcriptional regulator/anti-anti-sigma regulatory factor